MRPERWGARKGWRQGREDRSHRKGRADSVDGAGWIFQTAGPGEQGRLGKTTGQKGAVPIGLLGVGLKVLRNLPHVPGKTPTNPNLNRIEGIPGKE